MELFRIILALVYTAIAISLIWARYRFFEIKSVKSKVVSFINDPAVFIQLTFTYFFFINEAIYPLRSTIGLICYLLGLALFWWSVITAKRLDFAYSERSGEIVTSGPYSIVRHPFYLSYSLTWIGSLIIFDSIYLWGSTGILILLYFFSARAEEAAVLKSENAEKYRQYKKRVGMFLPVPRFKHSKVEGRT